MLDKRYRPTPIAMAIAVLATASILVVNFLLQPMRLQEWVARVAVGAGIVLVLLLLNVGFAGWVRAAARDAKARREAHPQK
jgi:protein-S-isoprenylcysteine O-methyltransferase Ste14